MGFLLPALLMATMALLMVAKTLTGEHPISAAVVMGLALCEMPPVIIGRSLGLPIETGGPAFIIYELNGLGYLLVVLFWTFTGGMLGMLIDACRSFLQRSK